MISTFLYSTKLVLTEGVLTPTHTYICTLLHAYSSRKFETKKQYLEPRLDTGHISLSIYSIISRKCRKMRIHNDWMKNCDDRQFKGVVKLGSVKTWLTNWAGDGFVGPRSISLVADTHCLKFILEENFVINKRHPWPLSGGVDSFNTGTCAVLFSLLFLFVQLPDFQEVLELVKSEYSDTTLNCLETLINIDTCETP